jgi:hypothetical protein
MAYPMNDTSKSRFDWLSDPGLPGSSETFPFAGSG